MKETWKEIPFAPLYEASNLGQVRNKRKKIIKQRFGRHGYLLVPLRTAPKKWRYFSVHRVIAATFLNLNIHDTHLHVHHKNQVKSNNSVDNLKTTTPSENMRERIRYDIERVQWIIDRANEGMSAQDILTSFQGSQE